MSNLAPQNNATGRANQAQPPPGMANARYVPTKEEVQTLNDCQTEASYRRGIPLGILVGLGAMKAVKSGYLQNHGRFGPWLNIFGFGSLGYFIGHLSYINICKDRILALPNSQLAQIIRHNVGMDGSSGESHSPPADTFADYSQAEPQPNVTADQSRPQLWGSGASQPSWENAPIGGGGARDYPTEQRPVSYEELRRRNRQGYEPQPRRPAQGGAGAAPATPAHRPNRGISSDDSFEQGLIDTSGDIGNTKPQATNKYGDAWAK